MWRMHAQPQCMSSVSANLISGIHGMTITFKTPITYPALGSESFHNTACVNQCERDTVRSWHSPAALSHLFLWATYLLPSCCQLLTSDITLTGASGAKLIALDPLVWGGRCIFRRTLTTAVDCSVWGKAVTKSAPLCVGLNISTLSLSQLRVHFSERFWIFFV